MRSDPDTLLVPLLRHLHISDSRTASHTYMLLIIILIFSQARPQRRCLLLFPIDWPKVLCAS